MGNFPSSLKNLKIYKHIGTRNKVLPFHYCTFFSNSIAIMQYFNSVEFYWLFANIVNIAIIAFLLQ